MNSQPNNQCSGAAPYHEQSPPVQPMPNSTNNNPQQQPLSPPYNNQNVYPVQQPALSYSQINTYNPTTTPAQFQNCNQNQNYAPENIPIIISPPELPPPTHNPQQVADKILQMAVTAYPNNPTVQVPISATPPASGYQISVPHFSPPYQTGSNQPNVVQTQNLPPQYQPVPQTCPFTYQPPQAQFSGVQYPPQQGQYPQTQQFTNVQPAYPGPAMNHAFISNHPPQSSVTNVIAINTNVMPNNPNGNISNTIVYQTYPNSNTITNQIQYNNPSQQPLPTNPNQNQNYQQPTVVNQIQIPLSTTETNTTENNLGNMYTVSYVHQPPSEKKTYDYSSQNNFKVTSIGGHAVYQTTHEISSNTPDMKVHKVTVPKATEAVSSSVISTTVSSLPSTSVQSVRLPTNIVIESTNNGKGKNANVSITEKVPSVNEISDSTTPYPAPTTSETIEPQDKTDSATETPSSSHREPTVIFTAIKSKSESIQESKLSNLTSFIPKILKVNADQEASNNQPCTSSTSLLKQLPTTPKTIVINSQKLKSIENSPSKSGLSEVTGVVKVDSQSNGQTQKTLEVYRPLQIQRRDRCIDKYYPSLQASSAKDVVESGRVKLAIASITTVQSTVQSIVQSTVQSTETITKAQPTESTVMTAQPMQCVTTNQPTSSTVTKPQPEMDSEVSSTNSNETVSPTKSRQRKQIFIVKDMPDTDYELVTHQTSFMPFGKKKQRTVRMVPKGKIAITSSQGFHSRDTLLSDRNIRIMNTSNDESGDDVNQLYVQGKRTIVLDARTGIARWPKSKLSANKSEPKTYSRRDRKTKISLRNETKVKGSPKKETKPTETSMTNEKHKADSNTKDVDKDTNVSSNTSSLPDNSTLTATFPENKQQISSNIPLEKTKKQVFKRLRNRKRYTPRKLVSVGALDSAVKASISNSQESSPTQSMSDTVSTDETKDKSADSKDTPTNSEECGNNVDSLNSQEPSEKVQELMSNSEKLSEPVKKSDNSQELIANSDKMHEDIKDSEPIDTSENTKEHFKNSEHSSSQGSDTPEKPINSEIGNPQEPPESLDKSTSPANISVDSNSPDLKERSRSSSGNSDKKVEKRKSPQPDEFICDWTIAEDEKDHDMNQSIDNKDHDMEVSVEEKDDIDHSHEKKEHESFADKGHVMEQSVDDKGLGDDTVMAVDVVAKDKTPTKTDDENNENREENETEPITPESKDKSESEIKVETTNTPSPSTDISDKISSLITETSEIINSFIELPVKRIHKTPKKFENCIIESDITPDSFCQNKSSPTKRKTDVLQKAPAEKKRRKSDSPRAQKRKKLSHKVDDQSKSPDKEIKDKKISKSHNGPYIRQEGDIDNPTYKIINETIDDITIKQNNKSVKPQASKTPTTTTTMTHISNIPTDKSVLVEGPLSLDEHLWFCAICKQHSSYRFLGDLFGPYYDEDQVPKVKKNAANNSKRSFVLPENLTNEWLVPKHVKGHKNRNMKESWVHETCALWSGGVFLIGNKVYGLKEASAISVTTACSVCRKLGANIGCRHRGCNQKFHYMCAYESECCMDEENFSLLCVKHKEKKPQHKKSSTETAVS